MDVLSLTMDLLSFDSTTGREGEVGRYVGDLLGRRGYEVVLQEVTPGRWNVYAHRGRPSVVLSTHLDTVPPYIEPGDAGDRIRGRGACDAKGIAAAMIVAAESLAGNDRSRIGLLFLVGEEAGSDGARAAVDLEPKGRALIGGEPTGGRLASAGRGTLRCVVRTSGTAVHSALGEEGDSAVERLLDLLVDLRGLRLPTDLELGSTSYNIGRMVGGVAANVVPVEAHAEIMFRTVSDSPDLSRTLSGWARNRGELEVTLEVPPTRFEVEPGFPTTTVSFGTDLPLLADWGRPYLVGPGTIELAHTDDESIGKSELEEGVRLYAELARRLVSRDEPAGRAG